MFKTIVNKLLIALYFIIGTIILEIVTFNMLGFGFLPDYFGFNFAIILCLAFFIFIIPNYTIQYVIYTIFLTIQLVLIYANYSLYIIYGDLLSFDMLRLIGEAGAAITSSFVYLSIILQLICVYLAIVVIGALLLKYCKRAKINTKVHFSIFSVAIILSLQCISLGYYFNIKNNILEIELSEENIIQNDKILMQTSLLKTASYKKFGTYGYFLNMIVDTFEKDDATTQKMAIDYFNSGNIYDGSESNVWGVDKGNNVIVIMMESLEWFGFGDGTYDRDLNNFSSELTPNVYSIIYGNTTSLNDDSIIAKNTFEKAKTNMSEGVGIMGNYPSGKYLADIAGEKDYGNETPLAYAMPHVLKNMGYTTSYVHSHKIDFYDRNLTHRNLGFETVIGKDLVTDSNGNYIYTGKDLKFDNWAAEGEFVKNALKYIIPEDSVNENKPFYTFYLNVSSHGAYTDSDNTHDGDAKKYMNYVKYGPDDCTLNSNNVYELTNTTNPTYTNWYTNVLKEYGSNPDLVSQLEYYQCGVCGLDEAIGIILNKLESLGIDDETTMLLYSDHNAYYGNLSNHVKGLPEDIMSVELNSVPMIISSPGVKDYNETTNEKYTLTERFCSAYDVVPTLFDLLGIKFNENLYIGRSLFAPTDYVYELNGEMYDMTAFYSITGGYFSQHIITKDFVNYKTEPGVTQEHIKLFETVCNNMLRKLNYLEVLNNSNLFNKLENNKFE